MGLKKKLLLGVHLREVLGNLHVHSTVEPLNVLIEERLIRVNGVLLMWSAIEIYMKPL